MFLVSRRSSLLACVMALFLSACSTTGEHQATEGASQGHSARDPLRGKPLPPATPGLAVTSNMRPASFSDMPGWYEENHAEVFPALEMTCTALSRKEPWREPCIAKQLVDISDKESVREYFEQYFRPYKMIQGDGSQAGLMTGYYEPFLNGSRRKQNAAQVPLHGVPSDLVARNVNGERTRGRMEGGRVVPYWTRAELMQGQRLAGREIVWADDSVEAFFMQVQGSGRVYLQDTGETVRLAFADQNGHSYKSIGRYLVDIGEMPLSQASAQGIKEWIRQNPARQQELFNVNPRYVFFREEKLPDPSVGPKGALGVPLTGQRSIAIDPKFIPLGAPVFMSTTMPNSEKPLHRLMMAQDTGYAIKGAVRADFFWGSGEAAGNLAGSMKQQGELWVLVPNATTRR